MNARFLNPIAFRSTLVVLAVIYLFSLQYSPYFGQPVLKVLPILLITYLASSQLIGRLRWNMSAALIASGIGDVFLALPITNSFLLGLGAFLVAQLIYAFTYFSQICWWKVTKVRMILGLMTIVYAIVMAYFILPDTGNLKIPVIIYLSVVCAMGVGALLSAFPIKVAIGALIFIVSDSILALGFFKTPLPYSDVWVMISYYFAQFMMVQGIIDFQASFSRTTK